VTDIEYKIYKRFKLFCSWRGSGVLKRSLEITEVLWGGGRTW